MNLILNFVLIAFAVYVPQIGAEELEATAFDVMSQTPHLINAWNQALQEEFTLKASPEMHHGQLEIQHTAWLQDYRAGLKKEAKLESTPKWWDVHKVAQRLGLTTQSAIDAHDLKESFILQEGKLHFNGNQKAEGIPVEILKLKNRAAAENNLDAAITFFQEGHFLNAENFKLFAERIHQAWIVSNLWAIERTYYATTSKSVYELTPSEVSNWVEKNIIPTLTKTPGSEPSIIELMVSYKKLNSYMQGLDQSQARVTLTNVIKRLPQYEQLTKTSASNQPGLCRRFL